MLGGIFLVVQIILILEFMFTINIYLIDRDRCRAVLVIGSAILFLGSFAMSGLAYYYYGREARCSRNIAFISLTIIAGVFCTLLSVRTSHLGMSVSVCEHLPSTIALVLSAMMVFRQDLILGGTCMSMLLMWIALKSKLRAKLSRTVRVQVSPIRMRSAGLLTAGMVFGYAVFLLWSALSSEPDDYSCVFQHGGQQETVKVGAPSSWLQDQVYGDETVSGERKHHEVLS